MWILSKQRLIQKPSELASKAFLKKWENETAFIQFFTEQWLIQNRNWYLGAHMVSPATNDNFAIVSFLYSCFRVCERMVFSCQRSFATFRTMTLTDWTGNFLSEKYIIFFHLGNNTHNIYTQNKLK